METVCLVTSEESFLNNYGAALQGYALFSVLSNQGYDVNILRYKGGVNSLTLSSKIKKKVKGVVKTISYNSLEQISTKVAYRINQKKFKKEIQSQKELFKRFSAKMSFLQGEQKTWVTLKNDFPIADIYVCGSDQIWNPMFKDGKNDLGYFLSFAPVKSIKIAYAPSFGVNDIPQSAQENLKSLLSDFKAISVREKSGVDILSRYAGIDSIVNIDPTMLLSKEEWDQIAICPSNLPEKYILCYRFCDSDFIKEKIDEIQTILGIPVISLPLSGASFKDKSYIKFFEAGPAEFIGLIKHATIVCTDSFHATVFSIVMKTPFVTFLRGTIELQGRDMDDRVMDLLSLVELQNRIIRSDTDLKEKIFETIDFDKAHKNIYEKSKKSIEWLKNALKEN